MRWPAGQLFSSLPCPVRFLYPSPYGGGAEYHPSWVRQVCPARPQAAHVGPTGPVFGLAGVVSLLGFQNRTQGHTEPSLISPFFPNALWVWQSYQIPLQLVFHCFLDGSDRVTQIPVPHQACLCFYLRGFCVDQSLFFQLSYVFCNRIGTHAGILADPPDTGPALMRFPVLAEHQVSINRQFART